MARITQAQWKKYISRLRQINDTAADEFREYVISQGGYANMDRQRLIDFAYGISTKYGEASAALSAEMYDAVAELSGVTVPAAVPAETATRAEVSKTVNGIIKNTHSDAVLAQGVSKLVKQAGADTILSNAYRDRPKGKGSKRRHSGALVAWIPSGDTCPFCLTLASKGWQNQTEWGAKNHAEHIHANCDCTYGVKFNDKLEYDGYDPEEYKKMYDNAEGSTRDEKINSMRRMQYQDPATRDKINAQKRAAYAERNELKNLESRGNIQFGGMEAMRNTRTRVHFSDENDYNIYVRGYSDEVNAGLSKAARSVAESGDRNNEEQLFLVDLNSGELAYFETNHDPAAVGEDFWDYIKENKDESFAFVHNHNTDSAFSETDMTTLLTTKQIPMMVAVRDDGVKYVATRSGGALKSAWFDDLYKDEIDELNKLYRNGIIDANERTERREELIVNNLLRDYTKEGRLVEYDGRKK